MCVRVCVSHFFSCSFCARFRFRFCFGFLFYFISRSALAMSNKCNYGFTRRMRNIYIWTLFAFACGLAYVLIELPPRMMQNIKSWQKRAVEGGESEGGWGVLKEVWEKEQEAGSESRNWCALGAKDTSNTWNMLCKLEKWHESGAKHNKDAGRTCTHAHTHTQAQPHTQTDRETDKHMHVGERGQLRVLRKVNRMKRNKTQRNKQFA